MKRLRLFLLALSTVLCSLTVRATITDGTEVYILSDYYDKVLGVSEDGTTPRISQFGALLETSTDLTADVYVTVVENSSTEGYYFLRNKGTNKYLCASTKDTWSVTWADTKGTGDEYLWKLDLRFGSSIVSKKNTSRRLGCDWVDSDAYIPIYYDKQSSSRTRWSVFPAVAAGYEASLLQAQTEVFTNSIGTQEKDYFQVAEAVRVEEAQDIHIISTKPFTTTGKINLVHPNAWVILENVRPSAAISQWLGYITVKGKKAVNGSNVRVAIYLDGAAIIPCASTDYAFVGYSEEGMTGDSVRLRCQNYTNLSNWNNRMRGFVLKRGYMATLASGTNGEGYSRVYVADHADIVVPVMTEPLNQRVSSVYIKRWQYVSKKGWCSTQSDGGIASGAASMKATWFYTWSADRNSTADCEYVPIRQHIYWPSISTITGLTESTHVLSFNEPEHSEQHNKCDCGGVIDAWKATTKTPDFGATGMRVGSPAPTDASWLNDYIGHVDDMAYRCDFVAIHSYWGPNEANGASAWYDRLKAIYDKTKRPVWITEWAYGASWTSESWPSDYSKQLEKNRAAIIDIVDMLERSNFIERYSYYQWDTSSRRFINDDGWVTPAGKVYRDTKSTFAYNASMQKIPNWWKPGVKTPTLSFTTEGDNIVFALGNTNGDCAATLVLERKRGETGEWKKVYEVTKRNSFDNSTSNYKAAASNVDRFNDSYRLSTTTIFGESATSPELTMGYIQNPDCYNGTTGWTVSNLGTDTQEAYDGSSSNTYWNQWKGSGLTSSMTQTIDELPQGDYIVSALLRAGSNVQVTLQAEVLDAEGNALQGKKASKTIQGIGNATVEGSDYKNGWQRVQLSSLTLEPGEKLRITASASGSGSAWWSADHFTLDYTAPVGMIQDEVRPNTPTNDDAIYDLQGRKIVQPTPNLQSPRIVIKNGKKILLTQ